MDNERYLARQLIAVSGADALSLLQKLVSQDLSALSAANPIAYTLLLTPQGKYLHDFFVIWHDGALFIDVPATQAEALVAALTKYKLRSDITFTPQPDMHLRLQQQPDDAFICVADPRAHGLGFRIWDKVAGPSDSDYGQTLTRHGIVEPSLELIVGTSMPIEYGLQNMHAISFTKGCYLGQELTARMQHKDLAKRRVVVAKAEDNQRLEDTFQSIIKDTNGVEIGAVIRTCTPYALLHVMRDHAADGVFNLPRVDGAGEIRLVSF